jgi:hypothetical protein
MHPAKLFRTTFLSSRCFDATVSPDCRFVSSALRV